MNDDLIVAVDNGSSVCRAGFVGDGCLPRDVSYDCRQAQNAGKVFEKNKKEKLLSSQRIQEQGKMMN